MERIKSTRVILFLSAVMFVSLFLVFQGLFRFVFLDIGDRCVFVWDPQLWIDEFVIPGGAGVWFSSFLVQFFHIPIIGPVLAAAMLTMVFTMTCSVCRRIYDIPEMIPLCALPVVFLAVDLVCINYSFRWVAVSFLFVFCVWILSRIRCSLLCRMSAGAVMCVLLCPVAGDVTFFESSFRTAASVSYVLCPALFLMVKRTGMCLNVPWNILVFSLFLIAVCLIFRKGVDGNRRGRQEQLCQLSFYARNGQWRYLSTASRQMDMTNYMLLNYANLALSYEDRLLEHWTDYQQTSPKALCIESDLTPGCMSLLSMIYWRVGNVAGALDMAFEANQCEETPFLLEMMAKANIVFGSYRVAEKYIAKLEKTLFFRNRAKDLRKLLSDEAVAADPELSVKRNGLPDVDAFTVRDRMIDDLILLLEENPSNMAARDYAIVYLILSRDASSLKTFVDRFYGTDVLPMLSTDMQIGLLTATDCDYDYCVSHGVSDGVIEVYKKQKEVRK